MSDVVASPHNTRVAAARKLLTAKGRSGAGAFLVEGPHAVDAVLRSPRHSVVELFVTEVAAVRDVDVLRVAADRDARVTLVTERVAQALSDTVTPQGLVAVVRSTAESLDDVLRAQPRLVVVLVDVNEPGNAGTVIRTADAAGADAVVLAGDSVDPHNPKCVRASAGSLFHLPVVRRSDAAEVIVSLRAAGLRVAATDAAADTDLFDLADGSELAAPTAWLLGNEAHGLAPQLRELADLRVRIPIRGSAESLNLAAAAAVCLYASAQRQRVAAST